MIHLAKNSEDYNRVAFEFKRTARNEIVRIDTYMF